MIAKYFLSLLTAAVLCLGATAQKICGLGNYAEPCAHDQCQLMADPEDKFSFIPPPADFVFGEARSVNITVNYTGFTTAAQTAFQYAVDIWAANLTSSENIVIDATFTTLGAGVLGSAGPATIQRNFSGAPLLNTWYPSALANSLAETDLSPGQADVNCFFNSSFNWYYGTDGNTPGGQYDFVSVVLHELGHGLGFLGSAGYSGGTGFLGSGGSNYIYDTFVENQAGTDIDTFASGTTALGSQLTGNQLYWNGTEGIANNGGNRPRMYAPGSWNGGSSFSHLNEGTYPSGNENSLMTPQIGASEAIHTPGPITYGMFLDMAWQVGGCAITDVQLGTQFSCNPVNNTYSQQLIITYENSPSTGFIDINGDQFPVFSSPQLITINNLPADGQPVDIDVFFTNFPSCTFSAMEFWTAPAPCCADIRMDYLDPSGAQVALKNWGTCDTDVSNYILSLNGVDVLASTLVPASGDFVLSTDEVVLLDWPALGGNTIGDVAVFNPGANTAFLSGLIDYIQWGAAGQAREAQASAAGAWSTGTFVDGLAPLTFIGDQGDVGVTFWEVTTEPCSINSIVAGLQTACDPADDTYGQELIIGYTSPPGSGSLNVNGVNYSFLGATSQVVNVSGLISDGASVDVTVFFTAEPGCTATVNAVFVAPDPCSNPCPTDVNTDGIIDIADILFVLGDFGCLLNCPGDVTGDGKTDTADILAIVAEVGTTCP
ncbi:MAG: hypothetical protein ACON34_00145 [Flavobacteriales bacterium]